MEAVESYYGAVLRQDWASAYATLDATSRAHCIDLPMLVGNQNSDTVVPFRINQSNGRLHPTGAVTSTPVPVSFAFGRVIT